jgi:hypothetical protein
MVKYLEGSKELRAKMPFGAIKEIAQTFNRTDAWVAQVIAGNRVGDPKIIECAGKVAKLDTETKYKLKKILKKYVCTN